MMISVCILSRAATCLNWFVFIVFYCTMLILLSHVMFVVDALMYMSSVIKLIVVYFNKILNSHLHSRKP